MASYPRRQNSAVKDRTMHNVDNCDNHHKPVDLTSIMLIFSKDVLAVFLLCVLYFGVGLEFLEGALPLPGLDPTSFLMGQEIVCSSPLPGLDPTYFWMGQGIVCSSPLPGLDPTYFWMGQGVVCSSPLPGLDPTYLLLNQYRDQTNLMHTIYPRVI
jgi:hypothetical protein